MGADAVQRSLSQRRALSPDLLKARGKNARTRHSTILMVTELSLLMINNSSNKCHFL